MYRSKNTQQFEFSDFYLPFSGGLDLENRWIALVELVPWEPVEKIYHATLCKDSGQPIVPARMALGALLIKEHLGLTDRGTVEAIQENPYLQFFIGREEFSTNRPFDASSMVGFRKRFDEEGVQKIFDCLNGIRATSRSRSSRVDSTRTSWSAARPIVSSSKCTRAKHNGSTTGL